MSEAIRNKLSGYEVVPPEGSWNRIADALNEQKLSFPKKIYQYEQQPPAGVWNRIAHYLDQTIQSKTKVVPIFTRYKTPIRYAAMAAVFFAVLVFAWPYIVNKQGQDNPFHNSITASPVIKPREQQSKKDTVYTEDKVAKRPSKKNKRFLEKTSAQKNPEPVAYNEPGMIAMLDDIPFATLQNDLAVPIESVENYMIYTDKNGHAMKLPKKLFDAFDCATKELVCREKIRNLQQRFASSAVSSDFTGVLEILRNLQENQ